MAAFRLALASTLFVFLAACAGPAAAPDERQLELLLGRPSVTALGIRSSLQSVRFEYFGGSARGPIYTIEFKDDDTFSYEGIHNAPRLGRVAGRFPFVELASWLDGQPLFRATRLSYGGAPDCASYTVEVRRHNGASSYFHSGWPVEDADLWGLFQVLQGITLTLPELSPGA